jgi:hypothetical protein
MSVKNSWAPRGRRMKKTSIGPKGYKKKYRGQGK